MTSVENNSFFQNNTQHTQPFYSSLDFVWDNPGEKVHFAIFWIFWCKMKITQADVPTFSAVPTILRQMPFLAHTHTYNHFTAMWNLSGTTRVSRYQKKRSPTHTHRGHQSPRSPYLLSPSTTIHGILPIQSTCSTVFFHNLSKFSLVYLLAWHPTLHTPYISSSNHYLLFATCAHTIATCFAVVLRLCHLILVSLSTLYLELYLVK